MGLAGGDFIEVVRETPTYFEVRVVENRELKFVGSAPDWKQAIGIADSWLARNGIDHYYLHRNQPWREKEPSKAQVYTAHKLTGLSEDFLRTLNRGQVSDLITSAKALLLPVEPIALAELGAADGAAETSAMTEAAAPAAPARETSLHTWQFQLNFS